MTLFVRSFFFSCATPGLRLLNYYLPNLLHIYHVHAIFIFIIHIHIITNSGPVTNCWSLSFTSRILHLLLQCCRTSPYMRAITNSCTLCLHVYAHNSSVLIYCIVCTILYLHVFFYLYPQI